MNVREESLISANLTLLSGFYPFLYILELTLKNRLYNQLKTSIGEDWFATQLNKPDPLFKEEAANILRRKPQNFIIKDSGLLVEAGLGFWVEFFNKRLYKETKGIPISIFKHRPKGIKRKNIYYELDAIKQFRNDLFHSRICLALNISDTPILDQWSGHAKQLVTLLTWFGDLPESIVNDRDIQAKITALKLKLK